LEELGVDEKIGNVMDLVVPGLEGMVCFNLAKDRDKW
jgi:hypothetical protein